MNYSIIRYMLGKVFFLMGIFLLLPAFISVIYKETEGWYFFICAVVCILLGWLLSKKPKDNTFYAREGFLVVASSWVLISLIGAVPIFVSGEFKSYTDALFEIVSGFTTTGASVCNNVEALSHSTLLWRSFSHWLGGMGVLVFLLAFLPMTGGQTLYFMKAESPGPSVGKQVPRMQKTAAFLYTTYGILTIAEFVALVIAKMGVFDAMCTAFATAGTGGFGNYNNSIGGFSNAIQIIVTVFMMLFGINFNLYFYLVMRKFRDAFKMEEVKWYLGIYTAAVIAITVNLTQIGGNFLDNLRLSAFQGASVMTTTGFSTIDFNTWPNFSKVILLTLMFVGACAGSTGGGVKISRILIYFKTIKKELDHLVHPRNVRTLKLEGKPIEHDVVRSANVFFITYCVIFALSVLVVSFEGFDAGTTFSAVLATFNNIGPGLNIVGPAGNFAPFSDLSKFVLMFDMLAGRLEIFPMLVLFTPSAWFSRR